MVVAALAVAGCGAGARDALSDTKWDLVYSDGCVGGFNFDETGGYQHLYICGLTNGSFGVTMDAGSYAAVGGMLYIAAEKATCPTPSSVSAQYTVAGGALTIVTPNGVLVFERNTSNGASFTGTIVYGCFDSTGAFTPSPLIPI